MCIYFRTERVKLSIIFFHEQTNIQNIFLIFSIQDVTKKDADSEKMQACSRREASCQRQLPL